MQHEGFERITREDYLGDLTSRPLEEVRAMRAECQAVEADLSYLRRLVQGRLDIVAGEARRREAGEPRADGRTLVASLAEALSERGGGGAGRGALPQGLGPSSDDGRLTEELDRICDGSRLAALDDLDDAALATLVRDLGALERDVSAQRSLTFQRLDALSAEITRRYRTGEASVENLLP